MPQSANIADTTYRELEAMLAGRDGSMNVEAYVNQALSRNIFFDTVREVKENTQDIEGEELDEIIDEAIAAVRAGRRKQEPGK